MHLYTMFFAGRAVGWVWGGCVTWVSQISSLFQGATEKNTAMGQQRSSFDKSCSPLAGSDLTKEGLSIWLLAIPSIKDVMIPLSRLKQSKPASSFAEVLKNAGVSFIVSIPIMILPLVDSLRKSCSDFFSFCLILSVLSWCFLQGVWNWQCSRAYMIPGWKSPAISQWFFANFEVYSCDSWMRWKHMQACLCIAMLVKYYHSAVPKMPIGRLFWGVTKGLYLQIC